MKNLLETYLGVMALVIKADGSIHPTQVKMFNQTLNILGIDDELKKTAAGYLIIESDLSWVYDAIKEISDIAILSEIIFLAYKVAIIDGELDPREADSINKMLKIARIDNAEEIFESFSEKINLDNTITKLFAKGK